MKKILISPVEGNYIHNRLGVSDARFKEINQVVERLHKAGDVQAGIIEAMASAQTEGEVAIIMFQLGRQFGRTEIIAAQEAAQKKREFTAFLSAIDCISGHHKPSSFLDMIMSMEEDEGSMHDKHSYLDKFLP